MSIAIMPSEQAGVVLSWFSERNCCCKLKSFGKDADQSPKSCRPIGQYSVLTDRSIESFITILCTHKQASL